MRRLRPGQQLSLVPALFVFIEGLAQAIEEVPILHFTAFGLVQI